VSVIKNLTSTMTNCACC